MAIKRGGAYAIILGKKLISSLAFFPRRQNNLGCHSMVWVCRMAIKILWLPQRGLTKFFQSPILVATKFFKSSQGVETNFFLSPTILLSLFFG
jgi:hypothetical protein